MALLNNAFVRKSTQVLKEYNPKITTFNKPISAQDIASQVAQDVPCVEVHIPERDWARIEIIIQAHERSIKHPVIQDAWDKYLMTLALVKPY